MAFVRSTHLVCHRLISSWKSDLGTSLAALELLKGLARANIQHKGIVVYTSHLRGMGGGGSDRLSVVRNHRPCIRVDTAIQVGGATVGQVFGLKI